MDGAISAGLRCLLRREARWIRRDRDETRQDFGLLPTSSLLSLTSPNEAGRFANCRGFVHHFAQARRKDIHMSNTVRVSVLSLSPSNVPLAQESKEFDALQQTLMQLRF